MSGFTIAQEREIRAIVAEMVGQVLQGADERLVDCLREANAASEAAAERLLREVIR